MTKSVLILGASGKVGRHSARAFEAAGWQVRHYNRQKDNLVKAAQGCDVIVNGLNPPNYHNWKALIPQITQQVIQAAREAQAAVILPGNVYHFGKSPGIWSEKTTPNPICRKGKIRLEMERAYALSDVKTIVLRAGNFIDPDGNDCVMSLLYLRQIKRGKITVPGPINTRQAMCYVPDWSRAAVALAEKRHELGQFEDIPFEGHTLTAEDIKNCLEGVLQRDLKVVQFPWWLFTWTSPVWELAREMKEMRYLWSTDHALSSARLQHLIPDFKVTALDEVLGQKVTD